MQQMDDPPSLPVGTEVSAKYKGAFCEAKVSKVDRNIKVKVAYKHGLGSGTVSDDAIKTTAPGQLRVGATVDVRHPDRKEIVEATITKIQDCSQYTVVFDDGDITTLRRTALCLKSGRHFNESETLDQLPLTHPEHFGNPVVGGRRGRRRGQPNEDSSDDDDDSDAKEVVNEKEEHIGKVVCVETESKKKDKEKWFPALVVAPTAQATVRIRVKDEYLVRSFKDGRYYTVPKKEATEFTREAASKQDGAATQAALEYLDADVLPPHWDRDALFGLSNSSSDEDAEIDTESSDDEHHEEKDRFVAQLYKYMDDRGTPLNKVPSIQSRDVDLYRLFRAVQKRGGYNRVTTQNQWKTVALRLSYTPCTVSVMNLVKQAYKKFLQPYVDFNRKLGCSMLTVSRNTSRSKGRSLVRANSVASPKPADSSTAAVAAAATKAAAASLATATTNIISASTSTAATSSGCNQVNVFSGATATATTATPQITTTTTTATATITSQSITEESENTSESTIEPSKKRKISAATGSAVGGSGGGSGGGGGKVKSLVEKYEEKTATKDESDVPISKIKASTASARNSDDKETPAAASTSKQAAAEQQVANNSDNSPSGPTPNKKEKHQRKQNLQNEEKRGKRKKDEVAATVEKIDTGDFVVEIGDKLKVYYHEKKSPTAHGSTYEAKVIEISVQRLTPMYLVHYTGWNNRYDEWVSRERIAENITKGSKQKSRSGANNNGNNNNAAAAGANQVGSSVGIGTTAPGLEQRSLKDGSSSSSSMSTKTLSGTTTTLTPNSGNNNNNVMIGSSGSGSNIVVGSGASGSLILGNSLTSVKTPTAAKRGRGRSDSMPPRSTTPSSVASNSSRTKSPAASNLKKRPTRTALSNSTSNLRRTSTNVSDASMATESETDSDEPVRKQNRVSTKEATSSSVVAAAATSSYKTINASHKSQSKVRATASRANSPSESDEDDDDRDRESNAPLRIASSGVSGSNSSNMTANVSNVVGGTTKGKDYDLNLIRSELKGFAGLKSPPPTGLVVEDTNKKDLTGGAIKSGGEYDFKSTSGSISGSTSESTDIKKEPMLVVPHEESAKGSSTDISSETDSFNDDDSQSSDKTTTGLENMPKKLISNKLTAGGIEKTTTSVITPKSSARILDHLTIKDGIVEKRQDSKKLEPLSIKEEIQSDAANVKQNSDSLVHSVISATLSSTKMLIKEEIQDEEEPKSSILDDIKSSILNAPTRFGNTSATSSSTNTVVNVSKFTSVIVEKPLNVGKKLGVEQQQQQIAGNKKPDILKKSTIISNSETAKKFIEPVHKETAIIKVEPPAACSPSSSSSSSSSFCSTASAGSSSASASTVSGSSTTNSTRSLPDMSKLEISGNITNSSSTSHHNVLTSSSSIGGHKDTKYGASQAPPPLVKPMSPDIYEFKDTEPFEFEIRKSPMVAASTSVITATTAVTVASNAANIISTPIGPGRKPMHKAAGALQQQTSNEHHQLQQQQQHTSIATTTTTAAATVTAASNVSSVVGPPNISTTNRKKRGSPIKESFLGYSDKPKIDKLDDVKIGPSNLLADAKLIHQPASSSAAHISSSPTVSTAATSNIVKHTSSNALPQKGIVSQIATGGSGNSSSSSSSTSNINLFFSSPNINNGANNQTSKSTDASSGNIYTPFDVLRKSPSFNLNINALNEELAQTVQETTRALTDALQTAPTAPLPPPPPPPLAALTNVSLATGATKEIPSSPQKTIESTSPTCSAATPPHGTVSSSKLLVSPKVVTPPHSSIKPPVTVGSPFIETRKDLSNVFELSSNECSGYSSGESKDNKFELENVKILLSASAGGFDLDPTKYEQKPSSIADKVLKAISQKKEEVENNKSKELTKLDAAAQEKSKQQTIDNNAITTGKSDAASTCGIATVQQMIDASNRSKLLTEPLKIQTELPTTSTGGLTLLDSHAPNSLDKMLGTSISAVSAGSGKRVSSSGSALSSLNSPEPKSILESISVKSNELSETIQKLECAIQRKTPVGGLSMASSTPTHTPTSTAAPTSYSEESMDSTDSEQRLVIEVAEELTTTDIQKSPASEASGSIGAPVKLESTSSNKLLTGAATAGLQAPIPLKFLTPNVGVATAVSRTQTVLSSGSGQSSLATNSASATATNFTGKLGVSSANSVQQHAGQFTTIEHKQQQQQQLQQQQQNDVTEQQLPKTNIPVKFAANVATKSQSIASIVVPIVVPDIPVSVVVAPSAVPAVKAAAAALLQSPKSSGATLQDTRSPVGINAQAHTLSNQHQQQQQQQQQQLSSPKVSVAATPISIVQETGVSVNMKSYNKPGFSGTNPVAATSTIGNGNNMVSTSSSSSSGSGSGSNNVGVVVSTTMPTSYYMERPHFVASNSADILDKAHASAAATLAIATTTTTALISSSGSTLSVAANTCAAATTSNSNSLLSTVMADTHNNESISLLCEETIPGSPAPAFGGKEDVQTVVSNSNINSGSNSSSTSTVGGGGAAAIAATVVGMTHEKHGNNEIELTSTVTASSAVVVTEGCGNNGGTASGGGVGGNIVTGNLTHLKHNATGVAANATSAPNSSPNDSASQEDESSEDLKKHIDVENELTPMKRKRTRKQAEVDALSELQTTQQQQQQQALAATQHQQQQQHYPSQSKRRRPMASSRKNTAGSDTDDNSDTVTPRINARQQQLLQQHLQQQQQQSITGSGVRPCPYNFLVELDPALSSDQCISILLKQIQNLRKTYNTIKGELATIDRRRKKLRRREREKKQQQLQNQQQNKAN